MKILGLSFPGLSKPTVSLPDQLRQLRDTVETGDIAGARALIANSTNPEQLATEALWMSMGTGMYRLARGDADLAAALVNSGRVTTNIDMLLFTATFSHKTAVAMRMLEMGADPLKHSRELEGEKRPHTAFDIATDRFGNGDRELVSAMLERLTQVQKDQLLPVYVQEGKVRHVRLLIDAGADALQQVDGHPLSHSAPHGAEEVARLLRSLETSASIEAAMAGDEVPPAPPKPSLTL